MSYRVVYFGLSALCLLLLLWKGGAPERRCGWMLMAGSLATPLVQSARLYRGSEPAVWLVDSLLLAGFLTVAVRANRYWPIWLCAIELCGVLGHVGAAIESGFHPVAYYVMTAFGAYLMWPLIVVGALRHQSRLAAYAQDPPWKR